MKILQYILLGLILSFNTFAQYSQDYIVLNTGKKINYKKFKRTNEFLEVKVPNSKDTEYIDINDVLGYYSNENNIMYFKEKNFSKKKSGDLPYDFYRLITDGEIKVFEHEEYISTYSPNGTNVTRTLIHYYAKKNNDFLEVSKSINKQKNRTLHYKNLISLINDNSDLVLKISDLSFKYDNENVLDIIEEYNVNKYKPSTKSDSDSTKIVFYRDSFKSKDDLRISLEDGRIINLPVNTIESLKMPNESLTKICFSTDDRELCKLIKPNKYFEKYYKVDLDKKGNLTVINESKMSAKQSITYIRNIQRGSK